MVLEFEQVGMRLHDRKRIRIALQPDARDENGRRNPVLDQRRKDAVVGFAAAGIERQRDTWRLVGLGLEPQSRLNQRHRMTGGDRRGKQARGDEGFEQQMHIHEFQAIDGSSQVPQQGGNRDDRRLSRITRPCATI